MKKDSCFTLGKSAIGEYREKSSKFIAYAQTFEDINQLEIKLGEIQKLHPKARHICYAYAIGFNRELYRTNDDGEPSGTAGKPIYQQILSYDLSFVIIAVVRYFGGIKLGTSGLIHAYKTATKNALNEAVRIRRYEMMHYRLKFDYAIMGDLMNNLKDLDFNITNKQLTENPYIDLSVRKSDASSKLSHLKAKMLKISVERISEKTTVPFLNIQHLKTC